MKNVRKEYPNTETVFIEIIELVFSSKLEINFSNIKRGMNAINIKTGKPISGHENANNNPLKLDKINPFNNFRSNNFRILSESIS